ncbi:methyltransferase domain-containing protein [Aureococcus anophagefferens]|nr:methyltransferase domain-containing protein [Aureococcus anophagefferens]
MALVSTELVLRGADGDLTLREPAGDLAPPAVSPERDTKALRGDPACYARALEQTVEAQQQEIRRGRAAVDAAEAEALAAARAAEATKTELINARVPLETDDRVAAAVAEAKAHARRAEGRAAEEADRADREVRRWTRRRKPRGADARASSRLVAALAALGGAVHVAAGGARKRDRRAAAAAAGSRGAAADDRDRGAEARAACGGAVADVAAHAAGLAESYLCVSVADVAAVADRADAARSACL